MAEKEAQKSKLGTVKDIIFVYTSTSYKNKQLNKENKPPLSDSPDEFHAYEVKILITESRYNNELKKVYGKATKNFPHAKDVTREDAMERFDIEDPGEDMLLIKFAQNVLTGKKVKDPDNEGKTTRKESRLIQQFGICGKLQDRNGVNITADTQIGNGTKGHLQFNPVDTDHGRYLYPTSIIITELVEYVGGGGAIDEEGIGFEELPEVNPDDVDTECTLEDEEEPPQF